MHEYMHNRGGACRRPWQGPMNKEIQDQKGNISRKTDRHKIKTRNTDPSVTFAGIAGHVAGICGHVHRNTH